ncbi:YwhD family protein [Bacillus sp. AK128]
MDSKSSFTILKNDSTKGDGGFGVGTISLENVTPVIIDPENKEASIDMGALHGRSNIEQRIKFKNTKEGFENSHQYWIVWIALEVGGEGAFYSGAGSCEVLIAKDTVEGSKKRFGYKSMPEHVNSLDKAIKRKFSLENMDNVSKQLLKNFLQEFNSEYWERSPDELKESLLVN